MTPTPPPESPLRTWSILSNHGLVLTALARQPDLRLRDAADVVGITERAAQAIVTDLVSTGYLERIREGRRNRYVVRGDRRLDHPGARGHELADLVTAVVGDPLTRPSSSPCHAAVLACSDYRFLEPLRQLIAEEGLLGRSEVVLLPGGGSLLGGRHGRAVLAVLEQVMDLRDPERLLLVAHQGCRVPGAFVNRGSDVLDLPRRVAARRRRVIEQVTRRLHRVPELWFLDGRGARHVKGRAKMRNRRNAGPDVRELAS